MDHVPMIDELRSASAIVQCNDVYVGHQAQGIVVLLQDAPTQLPESYLLRLAQAGH